MLEAFIRPRIRRELLTHVIAQPQERFYLRGLAKKLGLSVSPLHKELRRLEQVGLLSSSLEANLRYYVVQQNSPLFAQLQPLLNAAPTVPPVRERLRLQNRWLLLGSAGLLLVIGFGLLSWFSYLRRMEQRLQAFEGILAEFLSQEQTRGR